MKHAYSLFSRKSARTIAIVTGSMSVAFALGIETAGDLKPVVHETLAGGSVIEGDLNGNGRLEIADAIIALELAKGVRTPEPHELSADPDQNFSLTIDDALTILRQLEL